MGKSADAFRTISEVSDLLDTPTHVLRFWESKFSQIKPVKRAGGRRYYRPGDVALLGGIRHLLHDDGMTIRSVQQLLRSEGVAHVSALYTGATAQDAGKDHESEATQNAAPAPRETAPATPADVPNAADSAAPAPEVKSPESTGATITPFPPAPSPEPVAEQPSLFDSGGQEAPIALDVEPEPEPERAVHSLQINPARERASKSAHDSAQPPVQAADETAQIDTRQAAHLANRFALRAQLLRIEPSRLSAAQLHELRALSQRCRALRARLVQPYDSSPRSTPDTGI